MNLMSFSNNLFPFFMPKVFFREYRIFASSNFVIKNLLSVYLKKYLQDRSKFVFYKKYFCIKEGYFYQLYR